MMNLFSFHSIFVSCIVLSLRSSNAETTDRLALLAFKSQIHLDPMNVLHSWNDSRHFCEWEGVTCNRRRHPSRVTALNLPSRALRGTIAPHIGNLSFLRNLSLYNNNLDGEIPEEVGKLLKLEELLLNNNSLEGAIPVNISRCSNLINLMLEFNHLIGRIPPELGSLSKLRFFSLAGNELIGQIPPSLGNLTSLVRLSVAFNSLDGSIPTTLDQLQRLNYLSFTSNKFDGLFPSSLFNQSALQTLSTTSNNNLTGVLPVDIGHMLPNIERFYIAGNKFSGPIPVSLFNSSKLKIIDFGGNQLTGKVPLNVRNLKDLQYLVIESNPLGSGTSGDLDFITALTNCTKLQVFSASSNQFGGMLPASVGNLSNLVELRLADNHIHGNIPSEIQNLRNLIILALGKNSFSGSIPTGFENLHKIQIFDLRSNQLSGATISTRNMSQLYGLNLSENLLEGTISPSLGNQMVQYIYLASNNFTGPIPKEIGLSSRLLELTLKHNSFGGSIPLEVGNLKNLVTFQVSWNRLSGEIPTTLSSCSSLQFLLLDGNSFEGSLPSFNYFLDLRSLDVSHNNLSGNFPKELQNLTVLTRLNLSSNNLEGEVPIKGIFQNASAFSVFGNSKLCGGLTELGLPKCHIQRYKRQTNSLVLKVTLGVLIPSIMVGLVLVICCRKSSRAKPQSEYCLGDLRRVSYNDLHKATNGFSSANLIGVGSYGLVYKGILSQEEVISAVKVIDLNARGASKTFIVECEVLKSIRHRNLLQIVTVCSSIDFDGNDFKAIVLKFMPNGSLESWLYPSFDRQHSPRSLDLNQRLNIAIDVASALDYLHNHCEIPIVHCDLKPSNVLIDDDFTAHVGDFGLAKFISKTNDINSFNRYETSSIAIKGTIGYIPPEYGMGAEVSTQGDVYSYGILLLEMVTRKKPTEHIFKDELRLHDFSKMTLPQQVMNLIDTSMLSEETRNITTNLLSTEEKCLSSMLKIGVACSVDKISERMKMKDVLKELLLVKKSCFQV